MTCTDAEGNSVPTVKPKRGTQEGAVRVVRACLAEAKWATWEQAFLHPEIDTREGVPMIRSAYAQHRAETGRLSSGVNNSDPEKVGKEKVQQSQNIPKRLRDAFVTLPGFALVGGDWNAIQWGLAMWCAAKLETDRYHLDLLDAQQRGEMDPHSFLASVYAEVPVEEIGKGDPRRRTCKGYTFGYLFGGTPRGLARKVGHPERVGLRVCAAHDRAFRAQHWREWTVTEATRKHHIQTPLGWRRYFWGWKPKGEEILASIIQALEADLLKWTKKSVAEALPKYWTLYTSTHDFLGLQVPETDVQHAVAFLRGHALLDPFLQLAEGLAARQIGRAHV
jgi:DNA polymerase I-like protein with 3'-5' exonuclease and polymerase domains